MATDGFGDLIESAQTSAGIVTAAAQGPQATEAASNTQAQPENTSLQVPAEAVSRTVETFSKAAAVFFACAYGFGFLVVSLADAEYGILQFNLLKPRILAAGVLFLLLVAIPAFAMHRVRRRSRIPEGSGHDWLKWSFDCDRYFNMCLLLGAASFGVMWRGDPVFLTKSLSYSQRIVFALAVPLQLLLVKRFMRNYKDHPEKCTFLPAIQFVLANIIVLYVLRSFTGYATFVYWFFVVGLYAAWLDDRLRNAKKRQRLYVEQLLIYVVTLVTVYARFVYRALDGSIGGGRLPAVTVYLSQQVLPLTGLQEHLFLVDENDSGFYFVRVPTGKQAVFIPRSAVAALEFGEQPSAATAK